MTRFWILRKLNLFQVLIEAHTRALQDEEWAFAGLARFVMVARDNSTGDNSGQQLELSCARQSELQAELSWGSLPFCHCHELFNCWNCISIAPRPSALLESGSKL